MTQSHSINVTCPKCQTKVVYSPDSPHRPFCSERCRLLDLGAWADENYRIPLQTGLGDDDLESSELEKQPSSDDEPL